MPGHKRNPMYLPAALAELDITEVSGMDILRNPTGIIKALQEKIAEFYGADESFILVNGSSAGVVAAICAASGDGVGSGKLYAARNGHVSMFSGMALSGAYPVYITPEVAAGNTGMAGLAGGISPEMLDGIAENSAAIIVSPTYEGFVSDIKAIADKVHSRNGVLIVDEAHGAHFPFHSTFPDSALNHGADIVIQSFHKTLPALGQLAVLHVKGSRVDIGRLKFYLQAMQTTSPSYMLMAQLDYALGILWKRPELFDMYVKRLVSLRNALTSDEILPIELVGPGLTGRMGIHDIDHGKLLFRVNINENAERISNILLAEYALQLEMATGQYLLAMTSVADTDEGMQKLWAAIGALNIKSRAKFSTHKALLNENDASPEALTIPEMVIPPRQAARHTTEIIPWEMAEGRIAGEVIANYPPGIALVAPGERIPGGLPKLNSHIRVIK